MDTCKFLLKIKYNTDKSSSGRKTDDADKNSLYPKNSGLVKNMCYNANITKIEDKITNINDLATVAALNSVKNKIPIVSDLVKKQILLYKY